MHIPKLGPMLLGYVDLISNNLHHHLLISQKHRGLYLEDRVAHKKIIYKLNYMIILSRKCSYILSVIVNIIFLFDLYVLSNDITVHPDT